MILNEADARGDCLLGDLLQTGYRVLRKGLLGDPTFAIPPRQSYNEQVTIDLAIRKHPS